MSRTRAAKSEIRAYAQSHGVNYTTALRHFEQETHLPTAAYIVGTMIEGDVPDFTDVTTAAEAESVLTRLLRGIIDIVEYEGFMFNPDVVGANMTEEDDFASLSSFGADDPAIGVAVYFGAHLSELLEWAQYSDEYQLAHAEKCGFDDYDGPRPWRSYGYEVTAADDVLTFTGDDSDHPAFAWNGVFDDLLFEEYASGLALVAMKLIELGNVAELDTPYSTLNNVIGRYKPAA